MHGLINRAVQCFVRDTYGVDTWIAVTQAADLDFVEFEAMLNYDDALTSRILDASANVLSRPREDVMEDIGTYLVSNPNVESLRRLLRFGGVDFVDFLHSLDDLPDRARLAVPDLIIPHIELRDHGAMHFSLVCTSKPEGFGHVMTGILRGMADDYGALVVLEHQGVSQGQERIAITLVEQAFSSGRHFDLGART